MMCNLLLPLEISSIHSNLARARSGLLHRLCWRIIKKDQQGAELSEFSLRIEGMHCGSCIRRVTQALNLGEQVKVLEVRLGAARIRSGSGRDPVEQAVMALAKAGYSAHLEQEPIA
jgi:copper chaperone